MKKPITQPAARIHRDPVTGELVRTDLDRVRLAFERVQQVADGKRLGMDAAECVRFVALLEDMVRNMKRSDER